MTNENLTFQKQRHLFFLFDVILKNKQKRKTQLFKVFYLGNYREWENQFSPNLLVPDFSRKSTHPEQK